MFGDVVEFGLQRGNDIERAQVGAGQEDRIDIGRTRDLAGRVEDRRWIDPGHPRLDLLGGGARVLMISNEHPENVERWPHDPALADRVAHGVALLSVIWSLDSGVATLFPEI